MAAIDFLNPAPLMWDFEHAPDSDRLEGRYEIAYTTPANCARQLVSGEADLGLVPVAALATTPSLVVVPGCVIASLDYVRSILLVVRPAEGVTAVRTVALDTSSLTSSTYTRILFQRFWKTPVEFVPHAPDLESMLETADAAMLIGDPALLALEDGERRRNRTGEELLYLDLAHEWRQFTGLPWISAFWALRRDALAESGISRQTLIEDLQLSRDHGLAHIADLAVEWAQRIDLSAGAIRSYLTTNIHYVLDAPCLEGLEAFYRYAAECHALAPAPALTLLET
jgi:chorismate dehydratase